MAELNIPENLDVPASTPLSDFSKAVGGYLAVFFSSALTIGFSYYKVPIKTLQIIIVLLLVVILVSLSKLPAVKKNGGNLGLLSYVMLFLSSMFIQLLIASTGGSYSPFLILIHLFVIGTGFFINIKTSIVFLSFTIIVMIANIMFSPAMMKIFQSDPWSVVLYAISFIVIIPLAHILTRTYQLKSSLTNILTRNIKIGEMREESILKGLNDLVLITDKKLAVLSLNNAAENAIGISTSDAQGKPLSDVLMLQDKDGNPAGDLQLNVNKVISDKASRIINGYFLKLPKQRRSVRVSIQIRPVEDVNGGITQSVLVLSETGISSDNSKIDTSKEQAKLKLSALINQLRQQLSLDNDSAKMVRLALISHLSEDLIVSTELEGRSIHETVTFQDLALLGKQAVEAKQPFAQDLGVKLEFRLPDNAYTENAIFQLAEQGVTSNNLPPSDFSVPVETHWLKVELYKLIEVAILLSSGTKQPKAVLSVSKSNPTSFEIKILSSFPRNPNGQEDGIFSFNYGQFATASNLKFSSGLEGLIAKQISNQINTPISISYEGIPPVLSFTVSVSREVK